MSNKPQSSVARRGPIVAWLTSKAKGDYGLSESKAHDIVDSLTPIKFKPKKNRKKSYAYYSVTEVEELLSPVPPPQPSKS